LQIGYLSNPFFINARNPLVVLDSPLIHQSHKKMRKAIKIIKQRKKECLKHMRYLESKLGDEEYHKRNLIDDNDLDKEIDEFNFRVLECDVILNKLLIVKE